MNHGICVCRLMAAEMRFLRSIEGKNSLRDGMKNEKL
jgi:hypothetical protein